MCRRSLSGAFSVNFEILDVEIKNVCYFSVLKMLLEAADRGQNFQHLGHSFFIKLTTPLSLQITYLFFPYSLKSIL